MSSSSSVTRMYGLSGSGIDVDSMVKQLMQAAKQPYTALWQKQQVDEWKKTAYNDVYTQISGFLDNTVTPFNLQSSLTAKTLTSTNTAVAAITASGDAANVNHTLSVSQLATGVTETSGAPITVGNGSKLAMKDQFGLTADASFVINGVSITASPTESINDLMSAINKAGVGVSATYDTTMDRVFLYSNATGANAQINFTGTATAGLDFLTKKLQLSVYQNVDSAGMTGGALAATFDSTKVLNTQTTNWLGDSSFNLQFSDGTNKANYTFDTTKTLKDNLDALNSTLNTAFNANGALNNPDGSSFVYAKYNDQTKKLTFQTPSGTQLDLSGSDAMGIAYLNNEMNMKITSNKTGHDAAFQLDGVTMTQSVNNFTVAGINYKLQSVGSTNLTIGTDVDKIVSNVKNFITTYNSVLSSLYGKINETYDRDYPPLTDDQKSAMKDLDISLWTDKAKTGLLHSDSTLKTLVEGMRDAFSGAVGGVSGDYNTVMKLGISESDDWTLNGQLTLDETQLRAALQADPNAAYNVFGSTGDSASTTGIAGRVSILLKQASSSIVDEAGATADWASDYKSNLGVEINDYQDRLSDMLDKLNTQENEYYTRFNAMESAVSQISQQASYVSSLLGSS